MCKKSFECVSECKHLESTLLNRNEIHDDVNSWSACYYFRRLLKQDQDIQANNIWFFKLKYNVKIRQIIATKYLCVQ
jgi:hypothetical protein